MKKFVTSIFVTVVSTVLLFTSVFANVSGHWAEGKINSWISEGLIKGYEDGSFRPANNITRAEFVTLVNKAFGFTIQSEINFLDVPLDEWYYGQVASGVKAGYITGFDGNVFKPNEQITREQVAVVITKILNLPENPSAADVFSDSKTLTWSKGYVGAAANKGVLKGYEDGSFKPSANMTRAESVVGMDATRSVYKAKEDPKVKPPTGIPPDQINPDKDKYKAKDDKDKDKEVKGSVTVTTASYGSTKGTETISGNMDINYSGATTIKNIIIKNNLYINKGATTVNLDNVIVEGGIFIYGGTKIIMNETDAKTMEINSDKLVDVTTKGRGMIDRVVVKSKANLIENTPSGRGFIAVELADDLSSGDTIGLSGDFSKVINNAKSININLTKGDIDSLDIEKKATNTSVTLSKNTNIIYAYIYAENTTIKGDGIIKSATVDADKVTLQRKPSSVKGKYTAKYINSDKEEKVTINVVNGNGVPVRGARVIVDDNGSTSKQTDIKGVAEFELASGSHAIKITHPSFNEYSEYFTTSGISSRTISLRYYTTYSHEFYITNDDGALDGATVTLTRGSSSTTGTLGYANFNNIEDGVYEYTVSKSGYSIKTGTVEINNNSGRTSVKLDGSEIKTVLVKLNISKVITGDTNEITESDIIVKLDGVIVANGSNMTLTIGKDYSWSASATAIDNKLTEGLDKDGNQAVIIYTVEVSTSPSGFTAIKNSEVTVEVTVTVTGTSNAVPPAPPQTL